MPLAFAIQCPWALRSRSWFNSSTSSKGQRQILMMGGGPRTFPGGVSKWQWKKMQDKKAKQLLKARLVRERQLYEMRKRAELKAADLQKPWEKTSAAPTLFAVTADDQLQAMADRFVKRGAIDLWTDKDGPDSRFITVDGKPSARVFPRNAFHSTQPYTIAPKDYPPLRESNRYTRSLSPSTQQQSNKDPEPRRGKSQSQSQSHARPNNLEIKTRGPNRSIVARSISALASKSGQNNYNYPPKTKATQRLKSVNNSWQPRHQFVGEAYGTNSPDSVREPLYAEEKDCAYKAKAHVNKSGKQNFAGFNLAEHSGKSLRESTYKSKMDGQSRPRSNSRAFTG